MGTALTSNPTVDFGFAPAAPTAVRMDALRAGSVNGEALIEWETGTEADNLGFNVYREENGRRLKINSNLIAGSALTSNDHGALRAERRYQWWDDAGRSWHSSGRSYWIETLDLNGQSEWHGPVGLSYSSSDPTLRNRQRSPLLREIGRDSHTASEQLRRVAKISSSSETQSSEAAAVTAEDAAIVRATLASNVGAIKLFVKHEGWYRVSRSELVAAGLSESVNPQTLQLITGGVAIPMIVNGEADGRFDATDSIEFYGLGLDTPVTDTAVYWLTSGTSAGKRISRLNAASQQSESGSFAYTVERKDRTIYFASLRNGEADNFFGPVVYTTAAEQQLTISHPDPSATSPLALEIALQGVTEDDHLVQVSVNGHALGNLSFTGMTRSVQHLTVERSFVQAGSNVVRLSAGGGDVSLVDYVRLTYQHLYAADDDALRFTAQAGQSVRVNGFTNNAVKLFDVTDPQSVIELQPTIIVQSGAQSGSYTVAAQIVGAGQRELLAVTEARIQPVAGLKINQPSRWRGATRGSGADFVIVTTNEMISAAQTLKKLRQSEGLSVAIVEIEDVYDEFSDGHKSPAALREFLKDARSIWRHPPQYVLLLGEASYDPRNYLGFAKQDLVPSGRIDTALIETASDDWLADVDGDGVPDLSIGRLPVSNAAEAQAVVSKLVAYAQSNPAKQALLVSDENDEFNFEAATARLRVLVPSQFQVSEIRRGRLDSTTARTSLIEQLNQGAALVNYIGHGSPTIWRGGLFTTDDARQLTNDKTLSLFITMDCLNGYLTDPSAQCMAEVLIKNPQGGAIAVWASSGFTSAVRQAPMNEEAIRRLFTPGQRLGDVMRAAKQASPDQEVRDTWILFGDPTLKLRW